MSGSTLATVDRSTEPAAKSADGSVLHRQGVTEIARPDADAGLPLRGRDDARPPRRDFTRTDVHPAKRNIRDDDDDRAAATEWLIRELAPLLGLDPARIEIRVNAEAESRVNARGTIGLMEDGRIYLHPARYQPRDQAGRSLLAHEAAHAAQRTIVGDPDTREAEHEADRIGDAFGRRQPIPRAVRPLRSLAAAGFVGSPTPEKTVALSDSVKTSRSREIAAIKDLLSGLWVSDGDVFNVLQILESVSAPVAKAVVQALEKKERYWLADNINPPHVYKHRAMVLACYAALDDDQFDAIDLKVFRALPVSGLTLAETEAAFYSLRHLTDGQCQELLRSENGPAIARIIMAPRPSAEAYARLREEAEQAAQDEAKLAEERQAILQHENDEEAKSLFDQVKTLLSSRREGSTDRDPTGYDAIRALDTLGRGRDERTRFLYVAEQLEQAGLIDALLQLLPSSSYFDTRGHSGTLIELVQSRLPWKNAKLIEDLLSYGLFDWAIRDYEALFAYRLITLMPMAEQYRFRQRDAGKWYMRLVENLPDDLDTGRPYPGLEIRKADSTEELAKLKAEGFDVDEKTLLFNASQVYEKKLKEAGATQTLQDLVAAFREADTGIFRDEEAKDLFRRLVALGGSSLEPGKETPGDRVLREAIIHELDRLGYIDKLFGELPDFFLFDEANRVSTVKIMLARDPARVQAHARELVSRGLTDWMVTDGEAYLAYLCVKALPQDERDAFIRHNATEWDRIQGEMSESQRQSRDLNLYVGDKAGTDRASVLGRLAGADTWTDEQASLVDGLVRMAIAMTEHRFAFDRSKEFKAKDHEKLAPLVEKYRLWDPSAGRDEYAPDLLKGTRWYEEGIFADLKTLWSGLVTLWNLDILFIDHKIGAKVDLNDLQDFMGGDLMGAKLGDPARKGATQPLAAPDANKVILLFGTDGKSAEVILPELLIESANVQLASSTLQSGAITLKNLHIHTAYDAEDLGQPTQAHVELASVEARDLLLAKSSSMITVSRLALQALRLAAGTVDTVTGGNKGEREGRSVPFPLLVVPLLALFVLLGLPVYLYRKIAGLFQQGLESNTGEHFAADVAERTKAIEFSFSSLDVDGLTTSGGQHIEHIGVRDFAVRLGLNKPTRLRAEKASIEQRLALLQSKPEASETAAKLATRKADIEAELQQVDKDEQEYIQIKKQILAGGLIPSQEDALQARLTALDFESKGAAFIDIGSVEASGVAGTVTSKEPITLTNIHGEGGSAALAQLVGMPTATDQELSRRAAVGERTDPLLAEGTEGGLSIELGDVHTGEISIGGGIRSVADIDRKLEELANLKNAPEIAPLYESLQLLRPKAERYELMVQHGVSTLTPTQLEEFRELRRVLAAQASLIIRSIDITRLTLDVNLASGRVDVGAQSARIAGIQLPEKGIDIDEVIARGLGVGALPAGGLLKWEDWKKNLKDADGKVDLLQASGVRSKYHGLLFEKATWTGAYAKMKDRGDFLEAGLKNMTVEGIGIAPRIGLLSQRLAGLEEKAKVATPEDKGKLDAEITELRGYVTHLQGLAAARVAAYLRLEAAKTPDEIQAAKEAVAESDLVIAAGLAQYGASRLALDDFGVRVTGAGDVLTDVLGSGLDVDRILNRGARLQGTGPGHRVLRRFALTGANVKDDKSDSSALGSGDVELGETALDVQMKRVGDSVFVDLAQFGIQSFSMSRLLFTSEEKGSGTQIESSGTSGIEGVTLTGRLRLDKRAAVEGEGKFPGDFRLAHVEVTDFRIDAIRAHGLAYRAIPDKIEVAITSGSIEGIWAKGISIDVPETSDLAITGSAGIESITDLQLAGAVKNGLRLEEGTINGSALQIDFLKEGEIEATVGDLSATAMSIRGPDGWARFSLNHLSGAVNYKDGVFTLRKVALGSFEVRSLDWRAGTKHVTADKAARVVDVSVSGEVTTRKEPPAAGALKEDGTPAEPKTVVSGVSVSTFHIGSIVADHLIYEDGERRIEVGAAEEDLPEEMKGFKPLYIADFTIKDLEWDEKKGLTGQNMTVDVKTFEASAVYKSLKEDVSAGFALKGTAMGATFVGSNFAVVSTGVIEKTGGFYKGQGIDTTFKTGQIFTSFTIGDDSVSMDGLEIDKVVFGHSTYTGDDGKKVELQSAGVGHITVGKVQVDLGTVKDDQGKDVKKVKQITVDEILLTDIHADTFTYTGKSVTLDEDKNEVVKDTTITGNRAWIDRFKISGVTHDVAKKLTTLTMKIDSRDPDKPAFGIDKLTANIVKHVGTKETVTSIAGDVEGGTLTGDNISFQTIPLGKAIGKDGKTYEPVTRTAIGGQFRLTTLGLLNPVITLTDEKKRVTKISTYASKDGAGGRLVATEITPRLYPNGTMVIPIESIRGERLYIEKGSMKVKVPIIELKKFAAALKGLGTDEGLKLMAAKAKELSVSDLHMEMTIDRSKSDPDSEDSSTPGPAFFAEPVGDMTGELEVEPQLHHWYVWDPNVVMPIHEGKLNFENVHPYAVNLRKGEITLGNFKKLEIDVKTIPEVPGMHPEQGKYGVIDFREMTEGIMNKPKTPKDPNAKAEDPADLSGLSNLYFGGHLKLGKGKIGFDTNKSGTPDEGDLFAELEDEQTEDNELQIPWKNVGEEVEVSIKRLRARRLSIPGGKDFPAGKTGEATLSGIKISVTGLAKLEFTIALHVKEGKIVDIEFGDMKILEPDTKGDFPNVQKEPAPDLKAVDPKGEEGTVP